MSEFQPVRTIGDLATLDSDEIAEGYLDGLDGSPEPGNNRSRSYWHGWRNGVVDGHFVSHPDSAQRELVRAITLRQRTN